MSDRVSTDAITSGISEMGVAMTPQVLLRTRELYRPLVAAASWANRECRANISYGEHVRHVLDIYPSDQPGSPVVLFVHGGGFVGGDKAGDAEFYGNVGRYFAQHGFTGVTMNYRLAPDHGWPAGSEDVSAALAWLEANIAIHGGDAARLLLLGQSAGAGHSAGAVFDDRFAVPAGLRGVALMAGFYCAKAPLDGGPAIYFGEDEALWPDRSPVNHVSAGHVPVALSVGEFDPAFIAEQTFLLAQALTLADDRAPRITWFEGDNHFSSVHGLGVGEDRVGRNLREFFASVVD